MDRYKIGSGTLSLIMERYHAGRIPIEEFQISSTTMIGFMLQTVE